MKVLQNIRLLFQLLALVSALLVLGSLGAWENGNITLFQLVLQLLAFSALGFFCAHLSARRPRRRAPARAVRRAGAAHGGRPAHAM